MVFEKIIEIAATTLNMPTEEASKNCRKLDDEDAFYFWKPERGGISMIIDVNTGEKLAAGSSVSFDKLLMAYKSGKRN